MHNYPSECCQNIFQVGNWFITTSQFGQKSMKVASVFWRNLKQIGRS